MYDGTFEQHIAMHDVGVSYDRGHGFVMGEVMRMDSDRQVLTQTSGWIAYVEKSAVDASVKAVLRID